MIVKPPRHSQKHLPKADVGDQLAMRCSQVGEVALPSEILEHGAQSRLSPGMVFPLRQEEWETAITTLDDSRIAPLR